MSHPLCTGSHRKFYGEEKGRLLFHVGLVSRVRAHVEQQGIPARIDHQQRPYASEGLLVSQIGLELGCACCSPQHPQQSTQRPISPCGRRLMSQRYPLTSALEVTPAMLAATRNGPWSRMVIQPDGGEGWDEQIDYPAPWPVRPQPREPTPGRSRPRPFVVAAVADATVDARPAGRLEKPVAGEGTGAAAALVFVRAVRRTHGHCGLRLSGVATVLSCRQPQLQ